MPKKIYTEIFLLTQGGKGYGKGAKYGGKKRNNEEIGTRIQEYMKANKKDKFENNKQYFSFIYLLFTLFNTSVTFNTEYFGDITIYKCTCPCSVNFFYSTKHQIFDNLSLFLIIWQ